ncbi:hypothetical protein O181_049124 [Austropuccinia psidii MF-1]|uniref:Uncharacterized protein n=1 Tax=Austropuccinia psidii MF-1 TaxID=1389203 RepID=A0A9Q3HNI6_9BASI|nr:hypothetical protein [Austropuccinia psidii MF-1]
MEASTIAVEPVQKQGLNQKRLVKSASNKYGNNGTYWKKKKNANTNEEYSNYSKVKGSSKIKKYFSKIISKKKKKTSQVHWDFQCPGAQPTIAEEINPTKIQNSITQPGVEPTNQNLKSKFIRGRINSNSRTFGPRPSNKKVTFYGIGNEYQHRIHW